MFKSCLAPSKNTIAPFSTLRTVDKIDFHHYPSITKVTLNRPKALNALDLKMYEALHSQLPALAESKVIWLEGAGDKAFSAGGDIKQYFYEGATTQHRTKFSRVQFTTEYLLAGLKAVQIAVWDGIVMGGGYGISSMASFRIATQNTTFAMPQAKIGFFTDVASCFHFCKLRSHIGFYLGMTGARLQGEDVYISGLANYFIPRKHLEELFNQISQSLLQSNSPKDTIESILNKYHQPSGRNTLPHQERIDQVFGRDNFRQIFKELSQGKDQFSLNSRIYNQIIYYSFVMCFLQAMIGNQYNKGTG